ncbi:MAG: DsbA family oxidoreductase [Sphingomonadaceae bacterium]|uniref:DsbA family oxidoreductase n=1 Tax=Thermaurantiacus sp. TaxID=2820283 RepID=UPI00298F3746|nr:DsbA family oxidoreductase [Thermaurantiacus sp.]MCS6987029.1 DsbA family oxidoreductase [Sphingomonadaceae bacterium]MDW8415633.1 DsbA family oxidoreductase [Thermaurantiacus sp.]
MARPALAVDVVSDMVCPWCRIGWAQLARALNDLGVEATVRWRPFRLAPDAPEEEGEAIEAYLQRRYGPDAAVPAAGRATLRALAEEAGVPFLHGVRLRMWNTARAHRLLWWAAPSGRQTRLAEALFEAHFDRGARLSDPAVLVAAAEAAGLDPDAAARALQDPAVAAAVAASERHARASGVAGVPTFVFDGRLAVVGAQGPATFTRLIARWLERRPSP